MAFEQRLRLCRKFAEPVDEFFVHRRNVFEGLTVGEALVERESIVHVRGVGIGEQGRDVQVDFGRDTQGAEQVGFFTLLECSHCTAKHVGKQLESDFLHFARLLVSEHLSGASDFEVVHGKVKAGTEFIHGLNCLEALFGLLGQA